MLKRRLMLVVFVVGAFVLGASPSAVAHSDDPKVFDRLPRYEGPSYRRDLDPRGVSRGTFDAANITLQANITLVELNSSQGSDSWGYTSPSGREYAIICLRASIAFVEVTNPGNPQIIATFPEADSLWRDVKVFENYAYSVNETSGGIYVYDMANIDSGSVSFVRNVTTGGAESTHNVVIDTDNGYLYRCGGGSNVGLRIYDLNNDPSNPQFVASWLDRYVHDAQVVTWQSGPLAGRQIAVCCTGGNNGSVSTGLELLDVTNKSSITQLDRVIYPGGEYSHQVWLGADQKFAYVNDELDEPVVPSTTLVFDVSDPTDIQLSSTFTNGGTAITHNHYIRDGFLFAANYTEGLRVFDLTDPLAGQEIAFFDSYPENDATTFNGLWNVYPFFESGTIIGSGFERGLWVWTMDLPGVQISYPDGILTEVDPAGGTILRVDITGRLGGSLLAESQQLFVDTGSGFEQVPLIDLGNGEFEAVMPDAVCGTDVRYYVQAMDSEGGTVTSPLGAPTEAFVASANEGATEVMLFADTMETDKGWVVGGPNDTATTGVWERVDPIGTSAQPEDDSNDAGSLAWITGQTRDGGGLGSDDVDGGQTTLTTPTIDASSDEDNTAVVSFRFWYSNILGTGSSDDSLEVEISADNGISWVVMDSINEVPGAWAYREYRVADFVPSTLGLKVRFIASDFVPNSIVEAGIDDFRVSFVECIEVCPGDANGDGTVDVNDISFVLFRLGGTGTPGSVEGDANQDGSVDVNDISFVLFRLGPCA